MTEKPQYKPLFNTKTKANFYAKVGFRGRMNLSQEKIDNVVFYNGMRQTKSQYFRTIYWRVTTCSSNDSPKLASSAPQRFYPTGECIC